MRINEINDVIESVQIHGKELVLESNETLGCRWSDSEKSFQTLINESGKNNYELKAVVNGGAFISKTHRPYGYLAIDGNVVDTEFYFHGDTVLDLAVSPNSINMFDIHKEIYEGGYSFLRGGYGFSFQRNSSGQLVENFVPFNEHSIQESKKIYNEYNKRTVVAMKGNQVSIIVIKSLINGYYLKKLMDKLGFDKVVNLDGGSSTGLRVLSEGSNYQTPLRKIHEVICVYKKNEAGGMPYEPLGSFIQLTASAARLRKDVVNGQTNIIIPKGTRFKIVGLYSWKASDNFRWGWGEYNGKSGYFQYDPAVMHPVGNVMNENYKMRLVGSAARMRATPMGTTLLTVPNGQDIKVIVFMDKKQSDGFRWFYGKYNNREGYFQYDPAVMFPTND